MTKRVFGVVFNIKLTFVLRFVQMCKHALKMA